MNNVKPISNTEILIARVKGIFPFFPELTILQTILLALYFVFDLSLFIAVIPYSIIAVYYIGYLLFIQGSKLLIKHINKTNKR